MKAITSEDLAVLRSGESYYLVWYSAYWCGPCQRMDKAALAESNPIIVTS
jgi:thiol-disulfide isomerase/thioredoxin